MRLEECPQRDVQGVQDGVEVSNNLLQTLSESLHSQLLGKIPPDAIIIMVQTMKVAFSNLTLLHGNCGGQPLASQDCYQSIQPKNL